MDVFWWLDVYVGLDTRKALDRFAHFVWLCKSPIRIAGAIQNFHVCADSHRLGNLVNVDG